MMQDFVLLIYDLCHLYDIPRYFYFALNYIYLLRYFVRFRTIFNIKYSATQWKTTEYLYKFFIMAILVQLTRILSGRSIDSFTATRGCLGPGIYPGRGLDLDLLVEDLDPSPTRFVGVVLGIYTVPLLLRSR